MARIEIKSVTVLRNNYVYLLNHRGSGTAAVVDPGIAGPAISALDDLGWRVRSFLHPSSPRFGHGRERHAERLLVRGVRAARRGKEGDAEAKVLDLPGHTAHGVAYWFPANPALFCGDILYPLGSGRVYEGTPEEMWNSLKNIRELPPETKIYCAHDYLDRNLKFAKSIGKDDEEMTSTARR